MSQYIIISPEGRRFGPTDFQTLTQWAREGRVGPGMMVEDMLSGQTMTASAVPGLYPEGIPPEEAYADYTRPAPVARNQGVLSLVFGIVGLAAWCFPVAGLPVGVMAIVFGARSLQSEDRTKALIGIVLGIFCILMSVLNLILGAIFWNSLSKMG